MTARTTTLLLLLISLVGDDLKAQPADPPGEPALIRVKLPPGAKLTIGGQPTAAKGAERSFRSPPLAAGKKYQYVLKATWEDGVSTQTQERVVEVEGGREVEVDFTAAPTGLASPMGRRLPRQRAFTFTYKTVVTGLEPGKKARVWLPVPPSNEDQEVKLLAEAAGGNMGAFAIEPKYGNQIYHVEVEADQDGNASVTLIYRVLRHEVVGESKPAEADAQQTALFLKPDALVPIGGKPATLIEGKPLPSDQVQLGRMLYDIVNGHVRYSKDQPGWGRGDANWVCDSKFGNCTDFHSLFISLARTKNLPAKFEMGFSIPEKRGQGEIAGYHCWAKFKPKGRGWIPVDISEADKNPNMTDYYFGSLTEDRVTFSVGRDIELVPRQAGPPLNFFIYPYVEVDGQPHAADKVKREFTYEDLEQAR